MKTKTPIQKKPPAVTRENGQVTINAEAVDELFEQVIAEVIALRDIWQKISLKEELEP
jgi:hypothetical protein